MVWSFLSKNFLRFHWRDSLAHRWKRLRTRQGNLGIFASTWRGGSPKSKEEGNLPFPGIHLRFTGFNLSVFIRLCLWHIFQAFPETPAWIYWTVTFAQAPLKQLEECRSYDSSIWRLRGFCGAEMVPQFWPRRAFLVVARMMGIILK